MYKCRMLRQLLLAGLALFLVVSAAATQETPVSLTGVIDFHTHTGPDSRPRSMDDIEAARRFKAEGLRGMVLKNHFTPTFDRAALVEVFSMIGEHDLVLATGHVLPEEVLSLIPAAKAQGVRHILVTHPFHQHATIDQMRQLASAGAVMELDWLAVHGGSCSVQDYVQAIREVGAKHYLISSDFGQAGNPSHVDGLRTFIGALRAAGVSDDEVDLMARRNPARLLGLD